MIRQYNLWVGTVNWREILTALGRWFWPGQIHDGRFVGVFEREFAALLGVPRAYSFATGRMALFAILRAIQEQGRDEVILPAYTCVVVPAAVLYAGYSPVYVDIDGKTLQMNVEQVRSKMTPRTRAIIAPHNFGLPCDIERLREIAVASNVVLIEDCAHSLGSRLKARHLGTFGDFAFLSTDTTKNFCTGFGGVAVLNSVRFRDRLDQIYQDTGFLSSLQILRILVYVFLLNLLSHPLLYRIGRYVMAAYRRSGLAFVFPGSDRPQLPQTYPYPARLSNLLCWLGVKQLAKFESVVVHRRRLYRELSDALRTDFMLQEAPSEADPAPLRVSFLVEQRAAFQSLLDCFVEVGTWFDTVFQNYRGDPRLFGYEPGQCPVAESVAQRIVNLPTSPRTDPRLANMLRDRLRKESSLVRFKSKNIHLPVAVVRRP